MNTVRLFFIFFGLTVISSCDKIEEPFGEGKKQQTDTTITYFRKIFIEDFTGHYCGNCPAAARTLKQIHDLYGNKIVSMGVHAGTFADPINSPFPFNYPVDYRNEVATELDAFFHVSQVGNPNGILNRKNFNNSVIVGYGAWATTATELISLPPEAWLTINPEYSAATRVLNVDVNTRVLAAIEEGLSLVVYLTEDSLHSAQKDLEMPEPYHVEDYYHSDVLRGSMNGTWGNPLSAAISFAAGNETTSSFTYTLPAEWNAAKVHAVAVLYRTATKEVVQAEEKEIY